MKKREISGAGVIGQWVEHLPCTWLAQLGLIPTTQLVL